MKEHTILNCWCNKQKKSDNDFWKKEEMADKEQNVKREQAYEWAQKPVDNTAPF